MKKLISLLFLLLFLGCSKDEKEPETPTPTEITELGLGKMIPYQSATAARPITIGILFEIPYKTRDEVEQDKALKNIKAQLHSLFEGDYSLFQVAPFDRYRNRFNIYFGSMLATEDPSYSPLSAETLRALQQNARAQKNALHQVSTAQEHREILESIFQQTGVNPEELEDFFYPLDALALSVDLEDLEQVREVPIVNSGKDLTPAEKDWIVKKNLIRYHHVFDQQSNLDVRVIISDDFFGGAQGYAHLAENENAPDYVFMNRTHPLLELAVDELAAKTFVHEMGHIAGWFTDEYYPFETDSSVDKKIDCNCVSDGMLLVDGNSFDPEGDHNPWLQDKLPVEMPDRSLNYELLAGPVPNYDGRLFPGCGNNYQSYRTYEKSIMSFHYMTMNSTEFQQGFGPVHRYYMEELFFKQP